ncbi:Hint domain-containing protein [Defluviimonas salinarum]|uniref:Hint domain-containing protein n=1 Tax=Defluviimonas salinarum TaxID=2992147 RepID=A0ABT3IX50_9RHOB|nr:Hint domain-containing protein [Defluviimonas salinarum]MCW3779997.1 Hint domain-containing protein [Defluviimonas salinarum]
MDNDGKTNSASGKSGAVRRGAGRHAPREPILWTLPGFCRNARVATDFGDLPIEALRRRDPLRTVQGSLAHVAWVDRIHLDEEFLRANPDALPVLIPAGALGPGRPRSDLRVSPHQKINAGTGEFRPDFRMARDLTDRPGIMRSPETLVTYHVFHCGAPVSVLIEGIGVSTSP